MWQMEQSEERRGSMVQVLSEHGRFNLCLKLIQEKQFPKRMLCLIVVVVVVVLVAVVVILYKKEVVLSLSIFIGTLVSQPYR
jgi:hypothetical protein